MSIIAAVLSGFAAAIIAPSLTRRFRAGSGWLLSILPAVLTIYFLSMISPLSRGELIQIRLPWAPALGLNFSFRLDGLGLIFALLISGIGTFVLIYAGEYLKEDPALNRFYAWILIFMAAMLGVVLSDNLIILYVFWEITSFSSFALIGFHHEEPESRAAAMQALLVTVAGGLAMLAGIIMMGLIGKSFEISVLLDRKDMLLSSNWFVPIMLLFIIGAFTKSAQFPFHFWLPNAMQAPTPVSAYLHSATMVKAGIYLLARLAIILGGNALWIFLVAGGGMVTMLVGGYLALLQIDLKRLLAYATISVLGMLTFLIGVGTTLAIQAAMVLFLAHALYKGALFLVAGILDHAVGTRDVRRMGGLSRLMPVTTAAAGFAALSMAGIIPTFGFVSKELFYEVVLEQGIMVTVVAVIASVFLVFAAGVAGVAPFWAGKTNPSEKTHKASAALWLGPLILSGLGLFLGLIPGLLAEPLIRLASHAVQPETTQVSLKLWHGINDVFLLSLLTVLSGIALFAGRAPVRKSFSRLIWPWGAEKFYTWTLNGLDALARVQTLILQNGYLRYYLAVIVLTTVGLAGYTLITRQVVQWPVESLGVRFYEAALGGLILLSSFVAIRSRSRLGAIAALGATGYGVALIFLLFGAPDLAMTQFLVESLTVILFVFAFYHLPHFSELTPTRWKVIHALIAILAGGLMTVLVLSAVRIDLHPRISEYFIENSLPLAHGRNIVNVILVDFRVIDTLGEITVLAIAAAGVFAMLKVNQEEGDPDAKGITSPILQRTVSFLLPLLLLFSIFLFFRGHNEPGGGFAAGLVAGAAFGLYSIAYGADSARRVLRVDPAYLIAVGLLTAAGSGAVALLAGDPFLTGKWSGMTFPGVADIGLGTPVLFDLGVFLLVIGAIVQIVFALEEVE